MTGPLVPSADGRFVAGVNAVLKASRGGQVPEIPVPSDISSEVVPAPDGAFADHDRDMVMVQSAYSGALASSPRVLLVSVPGGQATSLGQGGAAAGDPQQPGAFVSVAAKVPAEVGGTAGYPDLRVERLDAGHRPTVLATAAAINRALHQRTGLPVTLQAFPSPSGQQIAVEAKQLAGSPAAGIVLLSRAGQVLGSVPAAAGPLGGLTWSPSGRSLAFFSQGDGAPELTIWGTDGSRASVLLPPRYSYAGCLWPPAGTPPLLCTDVTGHVWVLAGPGATSGGTILPGTGRPVAWLP